MAYMTTALIDGTSVDRELESAICKIYGSESMWLAVNECIQICGGVGFTSGPGAPPYERMMRDTRILYVSPRLSGGRIAGRELMMCVCVFCMAEWGDLRSW